MSPEPSFDDADYSEVLHRVCSEEINEVIPDYPQLVHGNRPGVRIHESPLRLVVGFDSNPAENWVDG